VNSVYPTETKTGVTYYLKTAQEFSALTTLPLLPIQIFTRVGYYTPQPFIYKAGHWQSKESNITYKVKLYTMASSLQVSNDPVLTSIMSAPDLSKLRLYNGSPSFINNNTPPELIAESVVSDDEQSIVTTTSSSRPPSPIASRRKLQWQFKGLTLWLELEEFNNDLTNAVSDLSIKHNSPFIPKPHTTAIYGMEHLTIDQAIAKLRTVRNYIDQWPIFHKPTGITQDS
jgi:hypothetical protein